MEFRLTLDHHETRPKSRGAIVKVFVAAVVGLATAALLFPTGGVTGCPGGEHGGGDCISWSDSLLVRYPGENDAVGIGIALAAGVIAALLVYFLLRRMFRDHGRD